MTACFECEGEATERHHVVPKSKGGTKTVNLCHKCHGLVHGLRRLNISELTKLGMAKARALGRRLGSPRKYDDDVVQMILGLVDKKIHVAEISRRLNIPDSTVREIIRREICKS